MVMPASGKTYAVKTVVHEKQSDICWMVTVDPIDDIEYANLGKGNPPAGKKVWHQGYGFDKPRNREDGHVVSPENSLQTQFILNVSSGDSGGGIFDADTNEVLSPVCCTAGIAQKTSTWGGCCRRVIELRPKANSENGDVWTPVEIPTRKTETKESEWKPCDMPIRSAGVSILDPLAIPVVRESHYRPIDGVSLRR
jgi:hypothetical protein